MLDLDTLLVGFERREPATEAAVARAEEELGFKLPEAYVRFMLMMDGGEGPIGASSYLVLWPVEELAENNRQCGVEEWVPGLLLFGSDGGGEAYGFDTRNSQWQVVEVPSVGMSWEDAISMARTFREFLEKLYRGNH